MFFLLFIALVVLLLITFFFFSSRRRHTRWPRDWSSDVCSSDLRLAGRSIGCPCARRAESSSLGSPTSTACFECASSSEVGGGDEAIRAPNRGRSEERRVGKEGREQGRPRQAKRGRTTTEPVV